MQSIKSNAEGSLAEKRVAQLISSIFCHFSPCLFSMNRSFAGCSKSKKTYDALKKARRRHNFSAFGSPPKNHCFRQCESKLKIDELLFFILLFGMSKTSPRSVGFEISRVLAFPKNQKEDVF
jgi:hypothetical protein